MEVKDRSKVRGKGNRGLGGPGFRQVLGLFNEPNNLAIGLGKGGPDLVQAFGLG